MKKTFEIRDIDCANCALKIENEFKKIEGLSDAKIDFAKQKIYIDGDIKDIDANFLEKIAKKIESSVTVYEKDQVIDNKRKFTLNHLSVIIGFLILIAYLLIHTFVYAFAIETSFIFYLVSYLFIRSHDR